VPTVLREGPYAFVYFNSDLGEPPHIHVKRDRQIAKFWLQPIAIAKNRGFADHELSEIALRVEHHQILFLESWRDFFTP